MHLLTATIQGNPNIGLYGFATDTYCLLGHDVPPHLGKQIGEVLKVPVHYISICGTSLVGVFCAGNSKCLLVPSIAFDEEVKHIERLGIKVEVISTRYTALGNNIVCTDTAALVNPEFSADTKKIIRQALTVALRPGVIANQENVGALSVVNGNKGIIHPEVSEEELSYLREFMDVSFTKTTVNEANPYLRSGVLCNKNGLIIGAASAGTEMADIDEALGFLGKD